MSTVRAKECRENGLKEMKTSWEGVKRKALNRLGWRRSTVSSVGLRQLDAVLSC